MTEALSEAGAFSRLLRVLEPLRLSDDMPLHDAIPGAWPTVGDLRALLAENERFQAAVRDIDAHATPYGEEEPPTAYLITCGSLHRALGLTGAAAKCVDLPCPRAERAEARVAELEKALRETLIDHEGLLNTIGASKSPWLQKVHHNAKARFDHINAKRALDPS